MSYESFGGGSHGSHEWVPVGYERFPQWADDGGPIPDSTSYRVPTRLSDKTYIVRACRDCAEVWVQEFDWAVAAR